MSWTILVSLVLVLGAALSALWLRRSELSSMAVRVRERDRAVAAGSAEAQLQHPVVDLSRCLGCATCVAACPEDGVLEIVHGQAQVVHGARCVGVANCERECPVGAIQVTLSNLDTRTDVPVIDDQLEAVGSPGLYLAGEVTAHALIKTAVDHGTAVARQVAERCAVDPEDEPDVLDLLIVGAGPAGLACALEARRQGLEFQVIEQEQGPGGTVAKYPRRKLVTTQPVELPLYGTLERASYTKEELVDIWSGISAEHELPIRGGVRMESLEALESGSSNAYLVRTSEGETIARNVCLALGRRGSPRKLGVQGEDLPKVAYSLLDASSYQGRRLLVVGGGDSAVETALGLADQEGNTVTLSYRKDTFHRIRARNLERLEEAEADGSLEVVRNSQLTEVRPDEVELAIVEGAGIEKRVLPNDEVFVMAGGVPPFELLERAGVSFDPQLREAPTPLVEQGTGFSRAVTVAFGLALATLMWAVWHADYYVLPAEARPEHEKHAWLRPGLGLGLWLGVLSALMVVINLVYIARRSNHPWVARLTWGSLTAWMTSHVATGVLALLLATLHGAMAPRDTAGGHAWLAMVVLLVTGAIGRYFYAYIPRATNGRELELAEVKARLARIDSAWDQGQRRFRERARNEVQDLIDKRQWGGGFFSRVLALVGVQWDLRRTVRALRHEARMEGIGEDQVQETLQLARTAAHTALMASHFEDLRAVLNSWRFLHRWVALLMVLLILMHVIYALAYGSIVSNGGLT